MLLSGEIIRVDIGLGHNNDRGMFKLTGMKDKLEEMVLKFLADKGYTAYSTLILPANRNNASIVDSSIREWDKEQKSLRSVVEVVIGLVGNFKVTSEKFKQSPELQAICIMIAYQLTNWTLKQYPIRLSVPQRRTSIVHPSNLYKN